MNIIVAPMCVLHNRNLLLPIVDLQNFAIHLFLLALKFNLINIYAAPVLSHERYYGRAVLNEFIMNVDKKLDLSQEIGFGVW